MPRAPVAEEARVSKAKSVFEYMSEKEKERLASILAGVKEGPPPALLASGPKEEVQIAPPPPADEVNIPPLSPRTASSALRGYMPYNDDAEKQERYRTYLVSQTYNTKEPNPVLKPGASFDAINKELDDFASSARIFKPMAFAMSSRFTSGSTSLAASDLKQAKPGLHIYDATKAKPEPAKDVEPEKKALTPREQAADQGMYGRLTREVTEFYPVKLLCKRFGVADPHPEGKPEAAGTGTSTPGNGLEGGPLPKNDASWESAFVHQGEEDKGASETVNDETGVERAPRTIAEVGMAGDSNQGRDTLTYTKPTIDIFKAIFASDDEDDSDDEDEAVDVKPIIPAPMKPRAPPPPQINENPLAAEDLAAFKPVYRKAPEPSEVDKKKRKEKKKRKGVLSFDVGDEGEGDDARTEERRKKRKEREVPAATADEQAASAPAEEEWAEKTGIPTARAAHRKGAADFM
jgi:G patch domain-containing protein 1